MSVRLGVGKAPMSTEGATRRLPGPGGGGDVVVVVVPGGRAVVVVAPELRPQAAPFRRQLAGGAVPAATNPKVTLPPIATVAL
jgi:hypothetical protein